MPVGFDHAEAEARHLVGIADDNKVRFVFWKYISIDVILCFPGRQAVDGRDHRPLWHVRWLTSHRLRWATAEARPRRAVTGHELPKRFRLVLSGQRKWCSTVCLLTCWWVWYECVNESVWYWFKCLTRFFSNISPEQVISYSHFLAHLTLLLAPQLSLVLFPCFVLLIIIWSVINEQKVVLSSF